MRSAKGLLPKTLIGIVVAYLGVLILLPIAAIFQGAFARGAEEFFNALMDPRVQNAFQLSATLAIAAVALNTVFGTIAAWVLVRQDF